MSQGQQTNNCVRIWPYRISHSFKLSKNLPNCRYVTHSGNEKVIPHPDGPKTYKPIRIIHKAAIIVEMFGVVMYNDSVMIVGRTLITIALRNPTRYKFSIFGQENVIFDKRMHMVHVSRLYFNLIVLVLVYS
jgi:hypothetical protein